LKFKTGEISKSIYKKSLTGFSELADKVGVTRQTIVAIENGKYSPTLELAFRIANVFNSPLEEVFSFNIDDDSK
jgi:putative transcriptional regulator